MVVRLLVLNGECVVAASFLFLQTSLCSQKNNISSLSFSSQKSSFCFSKIISPLLWISLKKICFCPLWKKSALCLDLSFKKKEVLPASFFLFIWQPYLLNYACDSLFNMESMTANMES